MSTARDIRSVIDEIIADRAAMAPVLRSNSAEFVGGRLATLITTIGEGFVHGFVLDEDNERAYLAACCWANAMPFTCASGPGDVNRGLYIAGPTGSGKTLLTKVLRKFADVCDAHVKTFGYAYRLGGFVDVRADEIVAEVARTGDLSSWVTAPVLCVQDVGAEPVEALYMGNRIPVIRQLIERRADRDGGLLIITSNVLPSDLADRYGDRVASRIPELCNLIVMAGSDRRRKFANL